MKRLCLLFLLIAILTPGCSGARPADAPGVGLTGLEGALANRFIHAGQPAVVIARLRVGTRTPPATPRAPVNVALVIDTSGSMEGAPIEDARAASLAMMDALADDDRLAVVVFHSRAEVLLPSTELGGSSRREARAKIQAMKAQGTTDMAGGLRAGIDEVTRNLDPHGINRVVLVGDGVPNVEGEIRALAQRAAGVGIPITALGLGPDYNETLMGAVAQLSGGQFHYARESSMVAGFFKEEVLRLKQVYAKGAVVEITPGPGVRIEGVVGQQAVPSAAGGVRVSLGDISRTDDRDLVVRLAVDAHRDGAPVELCDAVLRYEDAWGDSGPVERRLFLGARATSSEKDLAAGRDRGIEDSAATAEAAAKTLAAIEMVRNGDGAGGRDVLNQAAEQADKAAAVNSNEVLRQQARSMKSLGDELPSPAPAAAMPDAAPIAAAPMKAPPAAKIRAVHDEAMQFLQ